jgi:hypothetical protein
VQDVPGPLKPIVVPPRPNDNLVGLEGSVPPTITYGLTQRYRTVR